MNDPDRFRSLHKKANALCAHLEKLCANLVCVVRSGSLDGFEALESRKTIVLEELLRMIKSPAFSESPDSMRDIGVRVKSALGSELEAVRAKAGQITTKLSLLRSRAQDLAKLRSSYGSAESFTQGKRLMFHDNIIARG